MSYQLAREDRCEVVCHTGDYGDASIEVSTDVRDSLVLVLPVGEHDVSILPPEKALELATVLVRMAGDVSRLSCISIRQQLVQISRIVDNLLHIRHNADVS